MAEMNCPICNRLTPEQYIEKHHLVPRHKGGAKGETLLVCRNCGDMLHKLFDNKSLAKQYNELGKILSDERVQKWSQWANKKPNDFNICMKTKK